jgi:hypothetical protein
MSAEKQGSGQAVCSAVALKTMGGNETIADGCDDECSAAAGQALAVEPV